MSFGFDIQIISEVISEINKRNFGGLVGMKS